MIVRDVAMLLIGLGLGMLLTVMIAWRATARRERRMQGPWMIRRDK